MLMAPIANRDPRVFPCPNSFIADRSPNKHLGLSAAVRRCLSAHVLRVEARIVLEEFLTRIPEFELDRSKTPKMDRGSARRNGWRADRI